jgi:hypothetical protein
MMRSSFKTMFAIAGLTVCALGCEKKPELNKVRFEVGVSEPVAKLVTYESTPPTDTSSKFHGIGEKGITINAGIAIVLNIEPRSDGQAEPLDGELSALGYTDVFQVSYVKEEAKPKRRIVVLAEKPGAGKLLISVDGHDGTIEIPITVK